MTKITFWRNFYESFYQWFLIRRSFRRTFWHFDALIISKSSSSSTLSKKILNYVLARRIQKNVFMLPSLISQYLESINAPIAKGSIFLFDSFSLHIGKNSQKSCSGANEKFVEISHNFFSHWQRSITNSVFFCQKLPLSPKDFRFVRLLQISWKCQSFVNSWKLYTPPWWQNMKSLKKKLRKFDCELFY